MPKSKKPLDFLADAQSDPKLAAKVLAAIEKGGKVTAQEVLKIAKTSGYAFTRTQFESAVRRDIKKRFAAGERGLSTILSVKDPPESSCAKRCLSYTTSYHPDPPNRAAPAINPVRR